MGRNSEGTRPRGSHARLSLCRLLLCRLLPCLYCAHVGWLWLERGRRGGYLLATGLVLGISSTPGMVQPLVSESTWKGAWVSLKLQHSFFLTVAPFACFLMCTSIFMRPNYTRVRKVCPQQGIWWAMKAAWWERKLPTLEQSHDISRRTNQSASQKTTRNIVVPPYKEDPSSRKTDDQGLPVNKLARPSARSMMDTEAQADAFTAALTTGMRSQERKKHLPFKLPYPTASEGRSVTDDEDRICRDRSFQDDASTSPS